MIYFFVLCVPTFLFQRPEEFKILSLIFVDYVSYNPLWFNGSFIEFVGVNTL